MEIKTIELGTLPKSYQDFEKRFKFNVEKSNMQKDTIFFEHQDVSKIEDGLIQEHYSYFSRTYRDQYLLTEAFADKTSLLDQSINESYFQTVMGDTLTKLLTEGRISMGNEYLIENTIDQFNLSVDKIGYKPIQSNKAELLEENLKLGGLAGAGAYLGAGALGLGTGGALAISGVAAVAIMAFMPTRGVSALENLITGTFSNLVKLLISTFPPIDKRLPSVTASKQAILKYDNIDADKDVIKMFEKVKTAGFSTKNTNVEITNMLSSCLGNHRTIFPAMGSKNSVTSLLSNHPQNFNLFKVAFNSLMGQANDDSSTKTTLISYRKCLAVKLTDIYKLLLINTLQNRKDHKRIMNTISRANAGASENILSFVGSSEEDTHLKQSILSLISFRLHLEDLGVMMKKGIFEVDRSAGEFLTQKLNSVDSEVEQYLRTHTKDTFAPAFEGKNDEKKSHNPKRDLLTMGSSFK